MNAIRCRHYPGPVIAAAFALSACSKPDLAATTSLTSAEGDPPASVFTGPNGVKTRYVATGKGSPVVLLHGFGETRHMWTPLIARMADRHLLVMPDLRGAADSDKPDAGYDKKTMAADVHALVQSLGLPRVKVVGHDIGLMVAYAYAAQYPGEVESLTLMDAFLPGVGDWKQAWLNPDLWHFHFLGDVPRKLVDGREPTYLSHFWNDFAADPTRSIPDADRKLYATAYARPGAMRASFEWFGKFPDDAIDFAGFAKAKLSMPILVLGGEKSGGRFLIDQACHVGTNVQGALIAGSGHWLMEEAPSQTIPKLAAFLDGAGVEGTERCPESPGGARLVTSEIDAKAKPEAGAGTSGASGIRTAVLKGDPTKPGLYTIALRIPPNTRIEAHTHPDDRVATVASGTWYIGYGDRFDEQRLRALPPGSFYTEPPNERHFARTGPAPVEVQITGYGPTGTTY